MWLQVLALAFAAETQPISPQDEVLNALAPVQGGLTAKQVVERALSSAPGVRNANAQAEKAKVTARAALLGFAPRIDLSAGYSRLSNVTLQTPPCDPATDPNMCMGQADFSAFLPPLNTFSISARLSIPASDYFLTIIHGYDATIKAEEVTRLQMRSQRQAVALQAIESFIQAVRARANKMVVRSSTELLQNQLEDLERLAEAGLATVGDTLQVKAALASTKVSLIQAEGAVAVSETRLLSMIHGERGVELRHSEDLLEPSKAPLPTQEEALKEALDRRYEVRALKRAIEARLDLVDANFGGMLPKLTIGGSAIYAKPNQRTFFTPNEFRGTWQIDLLLSWSPNSLITSGSDWQNAKQDVESAKADMIGLRDAIAVEVSSALEGLRGARASLGAAKEGLAAAEGSFADRKTLLDAGSGTTRELLESEQDLRRAQLQVINAHLDIRVAQARLSRALGRPLDDSEGERP